MARYERFLDEIRSKDLLKYFKPLDEAALAEFRQTYPAMPDFYLEFLRDVGEFEINGSSSRCCIYTEILTPEQLTFTDQHNEMFDGTLFFADSYDGLYGFETKDNWKIIRTDEYLETKVEVSEGFERFIGEFVSDFLKNETVE